MRCQRSEQGDGCEHAGAGITLPDADAVVALLTTIDATPLEIVR